MESGWRSRTFGEKSRTNMFVVRECGPFPVKMWAALSLGDCSNEASIEESDADDSGAVLEIGSHTIRVSLSAESGVVYDITRRVR